MARIELETLILAPPAACYALALNVQAHLDSTLQTGEKVLAGPANGQLALGDVVTWEARHLGFRQRLTVRITAASPPHHFRDELVRGAFKTLRHDHYFEAVPGGTMMRDVFEFCSPAGVVGRWFDRLFLTRYLSNFLRLRNAMLKQQLEQRP
ncbi:SRPBCC family protein [Hymenobacter properus]|uniref:SRPBCC family protein n=1 Tax=Hymenobacter properus TaxID=2791026 RepID=A0A931BBA3_9BACT|nr:SRPBCC family protein [Hymenobacter properus]MBF9140119.1 SRPBCC family protein [Hymenobacter properus]MBR7718926.1 SRPBCC family protein [Microvirga sp. SRT04]